MESFELRDKRSANGTLLRYETCNIADDIAGKCIQETKLLKSYRTLSDEFNSNKIELYFRKYFYDEVYDLANQISLIYWYERNNESLRSNMICIPYSPFRNLYKELIIPYLKKVSSDISIVYTPSKESKKLIIKAYLSNLYNSIVVIMGNIMGLFRWLSFYKETEADQGFPTIALNYVEGLDLSRRSDIFWFPFSHIPPSNVLVYFENKYLMSQYGSSKNAIKKIEDYNFRWKKVFNVHNFRNKASSEIHNAYKYIKRKIEFDSQNDNESCLLSEKDFKKECYKLINLIHSWHCFFSKFSVKIHFDPYDQNLVMISKAIAIEKAGGISIGKERSFMVKAKSSPAQTLFQNDIFFTWGKESATRSLETSNANNVKNSIIISGHPYDVNLSSNSNNLSADVKQRLTKNGAKFIILLFDNVHSYNNGQYQASDPPYQYQILYTPSMEEYYTRFLEWVIEEEDIGLIIKSKKPMVQDGLPRIKVLIDRAIETGRCYNVPDPFQKKPVEFAVVPDFVVSIGLFLSGALIESVLKGARSIFYDYPNLRSIERDLYAWGDNKVIFSNLDEMIDALKSFKLNPDISPDLGDWSTHLDELDPFRDMRGAERIGTYVRWLKEAFDKGLERQDAIECANVYYADEWGEDKIFSSKGVKSNYDYNSSL